MRVGEIDLIPSQTMLELQLEIKQMEIQDLKACSQINAGFTLWGQTTPPRVCKRYATLRYIGTRKYICDGCYEFELSKGRIIENVTYWETDRG